MNRSSNNLKRLLGGMLGFCLGFGAPTAVVFFQTGVLPQLWDLPEKGRDPGDLEAAPPPPGTGYSWGMDQDGDGLDDTYELVQGTIPEVDDSDGDGFSDLTEFVLHTNARSAASIPPSPIARTSASGIYQASNDLVHIAFFFYEPDGRHSSLSDRWALIFRNGWEDATRLLPGLRYVEVHSSLGSALPPRARIFEVGYRAPLDLFQSARPQYIGWHLYFSLDWNGETHQGFFNLRKFAGQLVEILFVSGNGGPLPGPSFASFRPLDVQSAQAQNWQAGKTCYLILSAFHYTQLGTGLVYYPVESAACESSPFSYCPPGCRTANWSNPTSQDDLVRILDPFALAGL